MTSSPQKLAYIEGAGSIGINIVLFALKYWVGITTGSVAVMADAWHTLSDSLTSFVVIFGAKIACKPPDREHPYGHGRAEPIASIIIGVLLFMVGSGFILDSFQQFSHRETAHFSISAIVIFLLSAVVKEVMAQFAFYAFNKTGASSLKADGWHHRSDAVASAVILAGIFFADRFWWIDAALGMVVSVMIIYTAIDIIREASQPLLGRQPDQEELEIIKDLARQHSLRKIHKVQVHCYGNHRECTLHACLPRDTAIQDAHAAVERFRKVLNKKMNFETLIHIEPDLPGSES